jgi:hypothetical protein
MRKYAEIRKYIFVWRRRGGFVRKYRRGGYHPPENGGKRRSATAAEPRFTKLVEPLLRVKFLKQNKTAMVL